MKGQLLKVSQVDERTRASMYRLFRSQFKGVSRQDFDFDLDQKNWLLLLRGEHGLAGFSTLDVKRRLIDGKPATIVFSGDTEVDPRNWQDSALSYNWMGAIICFQRQFPDDRFLWFLLVSGYRTYRHLPVFTRTFYPNYTHVTPPVVQRLMHLLARERFGERYDPKAGIVRLRVPSLLRGKFTGIPPRRLVDPHVEYFARRNPGHESGDELVCMTELCEQNLTRLGLRMWRRGAKLFSKPEPE